MTLLDKLNTLMEQNKLNKRQLSIQSDIPYTTIDSFFKVGYLNMKLPTFIKLCNFFGVTMESMALDEKEIEYVPTEKESIPKYVTSLESDIVDAYRTASPDLKAATCAVLGIKGEVESETEKDIV